MLTERQEQALTTEASAPQVVKPFAGWTFERVGGGIVINSPTGSGVVVYKDDDAARVIPGEVLFELAEAIISAQAPAPSVQVVPAEIAWQHMDAVRQFLEDTARTNSKDRDDWAEDVDIAINMLVRPASAPPAVQQPALDKFLSTAKAAGVTHWTPEMTAAVAKRSEEIAAAQQPAERPAIAHIAEPTEAEFSGAMDQVASNLPRAAQQSLANGIQPGETVAQAAERWAQWCERRCLSMLPEFLRLLARAWESAGAAQQPAVEPVARVVVHKTGGNAGIAWSAVPVDDAPLMRDGDLLYASPTAQPAVATPREARLKAAMERADKYGPLPGMISAFENHFGASWTDPDWRREAGVWAAAWRRATNQAAQPAPDVVADARRYAFLRDRFLGADFAWGDPPTPAILIRIKPDTRVWGDLNLTVDTAIDAELPAEGKGLRHD